MLKRSAELRQIGIVAVYWTLLGSMYFVPACRNAFFFVGACYFSFLNAVVLHNSLHQGPFRGPKWNAAFRMILSFGALYPASANVASHNLVHHHFEDDGQPDWAASEKVQFRWHLLNLLHFPNTAGPETFDGVTRWGKQLGKRGFRRQYTREMVFAFGLTALMMVSDFWTTLFFIVLPQLWGARGILRINLIQHDGCDISSDWNHSRNFVGRAFNWIMCNNGLHTIHHNRAGVHWSDLREWHDKEVVPRIDPRLNEPSMAWYLLRTFFLNFRRKNLEDPARYERTYDSDKSIAPRDARRAEAAQAAEVM